MNKNTMLNTKVSVEEIIRILKKFLEEKKAENVVIYNVKKITSLFDYLIICSSTSSTHSVAIYKAVRKKLKEYGYLPYNEDTSTNGSWIVLDYLDFMIHIFEPETRLYYNLENIWGDAPIVE